MRTNGGTFKALSVACAQVEAAMAGLVADDPETWSDREVRDGVLLFLKQLNQMDAMASAAIGVFDRRELSKLDGCRVTWSWLVAFAGLSKGAASGFVSRARLQPQLPALTAAAKEGLVSAEHLRKVADLAGDIAMEDVVAAEKTLVGLVADGASPADVKQVCDRIRAHVDPDGADPDPHAAERRTLSISRVGSLFHVSGKLDAEGGAILKTALDAMMRPPTPDDLRSPGQRQADAMVELGRLALAGGTLPTEGGYRPQLGILLTPQALLGLRGGSTGPGMPAPNAGAPGPGNEKAELSEPTQDIAASGASGTKSVGGNGPPMDDDARRRLNERAGRALADPPPIVPPGRLASSPDLSGDALECAGVPVMAELPWNSWAHELPIEVAQRISCDCEVWRVVLDPTTGLPLELGRTHRIVPRWLRRALHTRDRGCRWPGCGAPSAWTDVHHIVAWYFGGETNVDNCLLLCRFHHGLVHEGRSASERWRLELDKTTGDVHVFRPDGEPYELGPSRPYRPPSGQQGAPEGA